MPPARHRMVQSHAGVSRQGNKPLAGYRGRAPKDSGARMSTPSGLPKTKVRANPKPVRLTKPSIVLPQVDASKGPRASISNADREQLFGKFDYEPAPMQSNPEHILIDPRWVGENIVRVWIDVAKGIPNMPPKGVFIHHALEQAIVELFEAWDAAGLLSHILSWNGSYVPRFRRGQAEKGVLSAHAWGSAFDINASWNRLGAQPAPLGEKGSVLALVPIAESKGWIWGGRFRTPDAMHFEAGHLLKG